MSEGKRTPGPFYVQAGALYREIEEASDAIPVLVFDPNDRTARREWGDLADLLNKGTHYDQMLRALEVADKTHAMLATEMEMAEGPRRHRSSTGRERRHDMTALQWTPEANEKLIAYLADVELPSGLGTEEAACSVAAINLALTGEMKDDIPDCMSWVIGKWIIAVQDSMPAAMRNSAEWKRLLPLAAGTGRDHEPERLALAMDWMWGTVLPHIQHVADKHGFSEAWRRMCEERTEEAAAAARDAAYAAAYAAYAASYASAASYAAAAASYAASAAAAASAASAASRYAAASAVVWAVFNPCALLQKMIEVGEAAAQGEENG